MTTLTMLLTFLMMKEGEHQLVSTEAGFRQIEHLQLNFYGVKSEAQEQRIQVINPSKILAVKTLPFARPKQVTSFTVSLSLSS